jgi:hypothetical protein
MGAAMPAFSAHVDHVVGLGADKQVARVHAAAIVAAMENAAAVSAGKNGDRPEMDFPTHPVSRAFPVITNGEHPISRTCRRWNPVPTAIRVADVDISPKSRADFFVGDNYAVPQLPTGVRAIAFPRAPGDCARLDRERNPARLALKDDAGPGAAVATRMGAKSRGRDAFAKQVAANFAGGVAMLDRWCHAGIIALNDKLIDIIRKYGLAGLMAPGALAPSYMGER